MSLRRTTGVARRFGACAAAVLALVLASAPCAAREAAFMAPGGTTGTASADGAIKAEPKSDIDTGESVLNVARRLTLFFANQSGIPVLIEKVSVNNDGNVTVDIVGDDCSKQGTLEPLSRCSVEVSVTPTTSGPWSVEILMTHNGAGRIARARLFGKTLGASAADKKDNGLSLSSKDVKPIDFGDVEAGQGKVVRSALMVNDSPAAITLYSIDVIEAENGLQRLDQGCAVDMELKPGESCPVTLLWAPAERGVVSTDLIIRHSGRLGFAVIPVRGSAKGLEDVSGKGRNISSSAGKRGDGEKSSSVPLPPSAKELEKALQVPAVSAAALGVAQTAEGGAGISRLIGTVGNRAVLLKTDGTTAVAQAGEDIETAEGKVKVVAVGARSAEISADGKVRKLTLSASPELKERARAANKGEHPAAEKEDMSGAGEGGGKK